MQVCTKYFALSMQTPKLPLFPCMDLERTPVEKGGQCLGIWCLMFGVLHGNVK